MMEALWQDLRYSARVLIKDAGFSLIAVITLALGIGATTAIFSVVNGVLLRPLDYQDPQQIVTLLNHSRGPVSPANFLDLRSRSHSFAQMSAAEAWGGTLTSDGRPEEIGGLRMGDGLFQLLGIEPFLGRALQPDDFRAGNDHVLVLSHKLWQRAFGGDPAIVGKPVSLSGQSYTVVGVMPPHFQFPPFWSTRAEMWAPLDLSSRATSRGGNSLRVFARLNPGVSLTQAQAEIDAMNAQLALAYPDANAGINIRVDPLNEKVVGDVRPALLVLSGAVGFVLLIACANVACLLLARAATRQKETAVRVALGASRWRILRQYLTESMLLSLCGAAAGILLALWGVDLLTRLLSGNTSSFNVRLPRLSSIKVDAAAFAFTLVVSMITSVLVGLTPALGASGPDLNEVLKESGRGTTTARRRLRETLIVVELALAFVMLIGAGLLMNSFLKLQAVDPGFNPRNLLTMTTSVAGHSRYVGPGREAFYRQLTDQLTALPGVESASAINHLPLAGDTWGRSLTIEGRPLPPPGRGIEVVFRVSRPGYFHTMGIPFISGRDFDVSDSPDAPSVVIINKPLAEQYWPSEDPIGKRITLDDPRDQSKAPRWLTVVGIVKEVKQDSWMLAPSSEVYLPFQQNEDFFAGTARHYSSMTIVLRTTMEPESLAAAAKDTVSKIDHNLPVSNAVTMEQVIADALWQPRFNLQVIGLFGSVALMLASVGLYGVMSHAVTQRTREIGLRMALGAERRDVLKLVVGHGILLAVIGVAVGMMAAIALTRLMSSLLFGVAATDPLTFAGVSVLLAGVALGACLVPALRAAKVDPMVALRYE